MGKAVRELWNNNAGADRGAIGEIDAIDAIDATGTTSAIRKAAQKGGGSANGSKHAKAFKLLQP